MAATFDRGLFYARGFAMGQEHKAKGVNIQLGPVAGPLGRAPEGGRNWEGFSPDPVLSKILLSLGCKDVTNSLRWHWNRRDHQRHPRRGSSCLR